MTSPSHSSNEDFLESLGISLEEVNVTADADTHASVTGIYAQEYDWAGAILSRMYDDMCDLSRGHRKLNGTYYFWETWAFEYFPYTRPELIHTDLGLELVEVGPMNARLQSWIQADPDFQRSDALSRRRVVLSHPVLRRYYLGERVDIQIRGCRSVPYSPPEDMRAGKQLTLTTAHTEGIPHVEFILEGDYDEFYKNRFDAAHWISA
ncbi:hypothetical protein JCGZ_11869 [Jatropha curcas]|uniref:Aminotransferase-like plant mobile domain-containing protein n=1 Tax=Jatropha curcas TaxID=180498 RepID=A0A067LBV5_JATCU|nr:hypothetical protein JCGZ_11869 [Jatropha curcas]